MADFPVEHHYIIDHQKVAKRQLKSLSDEALDKDWMLYDYFGCLYVINLPRAKERLKTITSDLSDIGLDKFQIFKAVEGSKVAPEIYKKLSRNWAHYDLTTDKGRKGFLKQQQGETGCYLSHLEVIKRVKTLFDRATQDLEKAIAANDKKEIKAARAKARKYSSVMILEDDNAFGFVKSNKRDATLENAGKAFRMAMRELPKDWDMCYFMAWSRRPEIKISPRIVRLTNALYNNAYAVNHTFYDAAIAHLERIYNPKVIKVEPLDAAFSEIQPLHKCYAVYPAIAYQREGVSDITAYVHKKFRQIQPIYILGRN